MKALATTVLAKLFAGTTTAQPVTLYQQRAEHLSSLKHLDRRPLSATRVSGKPVIVSFFGSWLPLCNTKFEHISLLDQSPTADGLTIVAVKVFEDISAVQDNGRRLKGFLDRHQSVFTTLNGTAETAKLFGDVKRIPTVFAFNCHGRPRLHFVHAKKNNPGMDELRPAILMALESVPPAIPRPCPSRPFL